MNRNIQQFCLQQPTKAMAQLNMSQRNGWKENEGKHHRAYLKSIQ